MVWSKFAGIHCFATNTDRIPVTNTDTISHTFTDDHTFTDPGSADSHGNRNACTIAHAYANDYTDTASASLVL